MAYRFLLVVVCVSATDALIVSGSTTLHSYLCTEVGQNRLSTPGTVLQLIGNREYFINLSSRFCVVRNFTNLTITANGSNPAIVVCNRSVDPSDFTVAEGCGLAFKDGVGLKIDNLVFRLFGSVLDDGLLDVNNATVLPLYFGTNQTASLYLSNVTDTRISAVAILQYYGYALVIINSLGNNFITKLTIKQSLSQDVCLIIHSLSHDNYTCFGAGLLIYFHDLIHNANILKSHENAVSFTVMNSLFTNNIYNNTHSLCITNVFQFQPERVPVVAAGAAVTVYATQTKFNVLVHFEGMWITENDGAISGGLGTIFINTPFRSYVTIENTVIRNNNNSRFPCYGESLLVFGYFTDSFLTSDNARSIGIETYMQTWTPILISSTNITDNVGFNRSSSVYLGMRPQSLYEVQAIFENVLFMNNKAFFTGICMFVETIYEPTSSSKKLLRVHLKNINATLNSQIKNEGNVVLSNSSQFVFYRVGRATIEGQGPHGSSFVYNVGSVIDAFASEIYLKGLVEFKHNHAALGAAILLRSSSFLVFGENSSILFESNLAYENGGAIYSVEKGTEDYYCIIQVDSNKHNILDSNIQVHVRNNTAIGGSGSFAYLTPLFHCYQTRFHIFPRHLSSFYSTLFNLDNKTLAKQLSTIPTHVCVCVPNGIEHQPDCEGSSLQHFEIFPGDLILVYLVAYDDVNNKVSSQVNASLSPINSTSLPLNGWRIPTSQVIRNIVNTNCSLLKYRVYSTNLTSSPGKLNFAVPDRQPLASVIIHLNNCPPGFKLGNNGSCVCHKFFSRIGLFCNASTKGIQRSSVHNWIGIANLSYVGFAEYCPIGYCNISMKEFIISNPLVNICINNRVGILCGNCREGYSAVHGGVECERCSDESLWWLVANLSSGVIAVIVMFLLELTINFGTVSGIVFYANTFTIIKLTLNKSKTYFLPFLQIIEILNLHQAFPSCLFNGMQYAHQYFIAYAYSVYIWMIIVFIIIIVRCSPRLSRLLMASSVQVLVTFVHLSFAKILSAVIGTFAYTKIYTEENESPYTAWLYNGTIEFGTGVHLPMVMIASVSSAFVIIPFILVGTFGSMCLRYKFVNKFRPVIDTMHGPYKDKFRFWYGARLFLLVSIAVINPTCAGHGPFLRLLLQLFFVSIFTIIQAYIKPFASNWINILDIWCLLNVIFLLFINLFGIDGNTETEVLLFINIVGMSVTIVIVVAYHSLRFIRRVLSRYFSSFNTNCSLIDYCRNRIAFNGIYLPNSSRRGYTNIDHGNIKDQDRELTSSTTTMDSNRDYSKLREPLLEVFPDDELY